MPESFDLGSPERPLRVAIVGSGPSGFYAADALQKSGWEVRIDMFERLPTPFGLVRGGVAPDHPKIKTVTRVFERIAARPGFRFLGHVWVGYDVAVEELRAHYDALLFCCGAETDRKLGIPGETLPGSHTATEFVGWYNGHPDFRDRVFDLGHEVAVIVGQGNVGVDVARILSKPVDELRRTEIAAHALELLAESRVREVHLIGRRGPVEARFTPPEIREFGRLTDCRPIVDPAVLDLDPVAVAELPGNPDAERNLHTLRDYAGRPPAAARRRVHIEFLQSPVELRGRDRVEAVVLEKNRLAGEPGRLRAVGTGETRVLECGLFFRSIGYWCYSIPSVPYDHERGIVPNVGGRVVEDGRPVRGLYVAGWIKRGPSGVIGTNKADAAKTVANLLEDARAWEPCDYPAREAIDALLAARGCRVVRFEDWKKIDAAEVRRGQAVGKPREKATTVDELLGLID
jgi:ferredoxin--NADP+ reductase